MVKTIGIVSNCIIKIHTNTFKVPGDALHRPGKSIWSHSVASRHAYPLAEAPASDEIDKLDGFWVEHREHLTAANRIQNLVHTRQRLLVDYTQGCETFIVDDDPSATILFGNYHQCYGA